MWGYVKVVKGVSRRCNVVEKKGECMVANGRLLVTDRMKGNAFVKEYERVRRVSVLKGMSVRRKLDV